MGILTVVIHLPLHSSGNEVVMTMVFPVRDYEQPFKAPAGFAPSYRLLTPNSHISIPQPTPQ
ncbi:hypothetical protein O9929_09950 [Vibrio lentus]|nr:hypothetical protein [Vibrio lentus]